MKRRWKFLLLGCIIAFGLLGILFSMPKDDGLNWVRAYGGKETVRVTEYGMGEFDVVDHEFTFPGRMPKKLEADVLAWMDNKHPQAVDEPNLYYVTVNDDLTMVKAMRTTKPTWLERQWNSLQRQLGWAQRPPERRPPPD